MIEPRPKATTPTVMQLKVLEAYVRLGSQKQVAHELNIALPTVRNHMSALYVRLDVGGALEALRALGYIQSPMTTKVIPCGHLAYCSRTENHRGQHGGYRAFIRSEESKWKTGKLDDIVES